MKKISNPPPPSFPLENNEKDKRGVLDGKSKGFPVEHSSGGIAPPSPFIKDFLWRPNNYRRQIRIHHTLYAGDRGGLKRKIEDFAEFVKYTAQNKQINFSGVRGGAVYKGVEFQLSRFTLSATWKQNIVGGVKETYLTNVEGMERRKGEIELQLDKALVGVAKRLGVYLRQFRPEWVRHEDWVRGEEFIDSLPREVIIHDTVFKKVYSEGVEFVGGKGEEPVEKVRNYIRNRALEEFSPVLVGELSALRSAVEAGGLPGVVVGRFRGDPVGFLFDNGLCEWFNGLGRGEQDRVLGLVVF